MTTGTKFTELIPTPIFVHLIPYWFLVILLLVPDSWTNSFDY